MRGVGVARFLLTGYPSPIEHTVRALVLAATLVIAGCGARTDLSPGSAGGAVPGEGAGGDASTDAPDAAGPTTDASPGARDAAGPTCPPSTADATELATLGDTSVENLVVPLTLTVAGNEVYYGTVDGNFNPLFISDVPISGGPSVALIAGTTGCGGSPFAGGELVTDGAFLYTPDNEETSPSCAELDSLKVTSYEIATGVLGTLPNPPTSPGDPPLAVVAIRATAEKGVYWLLGTSAGTPYTLPGTTELVHWDGTSTSVVAEIPDHAYRLRIVAGQAFALGSNGIYQVPLAGSGSASLVVALSPGNPGPSDGLLLAANSTSVFYTFDGETVVRRDAATGAETNIVVAAAGTSIGAAWADDTDFYYGLLVPQQGGRGLYRVSVAGGAPEAYWTAADQTITAGTTSGCGVYWLAVPNPNSPSSERSGVFAKPQ